MEDLMLDCIDCLTDCLEYIDDKAMRESIDITIRMAKGRLEYEKIRRHKESLED